MAEQSIEKIFKLKHLDTKSPSFCGAKWYNASIWFYQGRTASCHHNPAHEINLDQVLVNPAAIHNTEIKKQQRAAMQRGEKPLNCQFCWVVEETSPDALSDRVWFSIMSSPERLETAFNEEPNKDYDLDYLEIAFERTCQMACSYCAPIISSSWAKDIRRNGPYPILVTDQRQHYNSPADEAVPFDPQEENPYIEAFFKWWDTDLHKSLQILRITGGEPIMAGHFWRFMNWLSKNPNKSFCKIHITTNLSYETETLDKFLNICENLNQPIEIFSSNESIGSKAEYVRDGLNWELWQKNLIKVIEHPKISQVAICSTPCAQSIDGYKEFLQWLVEVKKKYGINSIHHSVNPLRFPSFQNIITLPYELRKIYHDEIKDFFIKHRSYFIFFEQEQIARFLEYMIKVERPHQEKEMSHEFKKFNSEEKTFFSEKELAIDFKKFFTEYDRRRNKDFTLVFPRLVDWYNSI